jgi:hypothetical protein
MLLQRATQLWASCWGSFITGHFLGHRQGSQDGREPSLKGKSGTSNEAHGETNSSYELPLDKIRHLAKEISLAFGSNLNKERGELDGRPSKR